MRTTCISFESSIDRKWSMCNAHRTSTVALHWSDDGDRHYNPHPPQHKRTSHIHHTIYKQVSWFVSVVRASTKSERLLWSRDEAVANQYLLTSVTSCGVCICVLTATFRASSATTTWIGVSEWESERCTLTLWNILIHMRTAIGRYIHKIQ